MSLPNGKLPRMWTWISRAPPLPPAPRGDRPLDGEEIVAGIGPLRPFVRRGELFASLKRDGSSGGSPCRTAAASWTANGLGKREALKQLGSTGDRSELVVLAARYRPYVTDGVLNATLPDDMEPGSGARRRRRAPGQAAPGREGAVAGVAGPGGRARRSGARRGAPRRAPGEGRPGAKKET